MQDRKKIIYSLKALLIPVARFCLRHGLKIQEVEKTFKAAFLEAATKELAASNRQINKSTLSAATGIPRKFVTEAANLDADEDEHSNLLTRIVGQWQSSAQFQDSRGRPRPLSAEGADSEFGELVRSVTLDLNSYTILSEMERLELISKTGTNVTLNSKINLLKKLPEAMKFVGEDFNDLQMAVEENIKNKAPVHLHLTTRYDSISGSAKDKIQSWLLKEGSLFHRKAREFLSKFDRDITPNSKDKSSERFKVSISAFSFLEEVSVQKPNKRPK